MELPNRVTTFPTEAQWCALCDLILQDPELLTGEFHGTNGKARMEVKWKRISETLNKMNPGARKTVPQWKEALNGLKSRAKKAYREKLEHMNGTGGGPPREYSAEELGLSAVHVKACSLVGLLSIVGDQNVPHPLQLQTRNASSRQGQPSHFGGSSPANTASLGPYSRYPSTDPPRRNWDVSQTVSVSNQQGYGSPNLGGYGYGSPNQRGRYGSPNQRGQGYGSQNQRGHGYGSPNQRGHGYGSPNQRGHGYGSPNQRGHGYRSPNQRGHGYGSPNQRGHGYGSPNQRGYAHQTDRRMPYSQYWKSPSHRGSQGNRDHGSTSSLNQNLNGQRMYAHEQNARCDEGSLPQSLPMEGPLSPPKSKDRSEGSARKKLVYSGEDDIRKDVAAPPVEVDRSNDDVVVIDDGTSKDDDVGVAELPKDQDWKISFMQALEALKNSIDKNTEAVLSNGESLRILTTL